MNTALEISIDLSSATMPVLSFWHRHSLEANADWGYVEVSANMGSTWTTVYYTTGTKTSWEQDKIDLTNYVGNTDVRIRFRLQSNSANNLDGWYIDDVCIEESVCTISYPFFDDMEGGGGNWLSSSASCALGRRSLLA